MFNIFIDGVLREARAMFRGSGVGRADDLVLMAENNDNVFTDCLFHKTLHHIRHLFTCKTPFQNTSSLPGNSS